MNREGPFSLVVRRFPLCQASWTVCETGGADGDGRRKKSEREGKVSERRNLCSKRTVDWHTHILQTGRTDFYRSSISDLSGGNGSLPSHFQSLSLSGQVMAWGQLSEQRARDRDRLSSLSLLSRCEALPLPRTNISGQTHLAVFSPSWFFFFFYCDRSTLISQHFKNAPNKLSRNVECDLHSLLQTNISLFLSNVTHSHNLAHTSWWPDCEHHLSRFLLLSSSPHTLHSLSLSLSFSLCPLFVYRELKWQQLIHTQKSASIASLSLV